jgi:23S rRNA pseudouridine1911/1915/1917 synthase
MTAEAPEVQAGASGWGAGGEAGGGPVTVGEEIPASLGGERVDRVVAMLTGLPRAAVADLVTAGAVRLGGSVVTTRSRKVAAGEVLQVAVGAAAPEVPAAEADVDFAVAHADDQVVVVDKPAGLVVHPGAGNSHGTLVAGLLARYPDLAGVGDPRRPGVVHRLDKGTSGLLVVARTGAAYHSLVAQLAAHTVERRYVALAWGRVEADAGMVDAPLGRGERDPTRMVVSRRGRQARTRYQVLERLGEGGGRPPATVLECSLETGRTHQIRAHLAAIGHPVVGDARYGGRTPGAAAPRPFLHARSLAFDHPGTGERVRFTSPLPADLTGVLARWR